MMQVMWGADPWVFACIVVVMGVLLRIGWEIAGLVGWLFLVTMARMTTTTAVAAVGYALHHDQQPKDPPT